jgi:pimeloyl-ACP methyl ester carboxylesterase/DNA-binding SARP family transcriptional activator
MTSSDNNRIPEIKYASAPGARLAYQDFGQGNHTVVAVPPLAQNIEMAWDEPRIRAMFDRFASWCRYIHFDKRGTGASDRRSTVPGIDERVEDLKAIMDAAEVPTAHLFVQSDGGPMAIMFAATYPDRVDSITLFGSGATMSRQQTEADRVAGRDRFVQEWGTPASKMVDRFAPSMANDSAFRVWHERYERSAASADSLRDLVDLLDEMDVTELLPTLDVPTLVLHRTGDLVVPLERGREIAAAIPGAQLVEYDSNDHFAYVGPLDWVDDIERFITGRVTAVTPVRTPRGHARIVTLGRFAVTIDGSEVPVSEWGSRHARQLLKRLVAADGWPVTRDALIDMLWPDETDMRRLSARLSVRLSAVRRVLGGGVIADRESVRLDLDAVSTDLHDFGQATDDASIVGAYGGDFLPEDVYEDWTGPVRDEARQRFSAAARRLATTALTSGDLDQAIELGTTLVDIDVYEESGHRLLVQALAASGDQRHARAAHEAWQQAMAELDLTIAPYDEVVT